MPRIEYHVLQCSSQDPAYPAVNLSNHTQVPKGWCSPNKPECKWPIELVLSFAGEVHLEEIQILSHECKITSRIDVFVAEVPPSLSGTAGDSNNHNYPSYEECSLRRLGHLTFKTNEESRYRSRELKTVNQVNVSCVYLRLLIHEPYHNEANVRHQVMLMAVNLMGFVHRTLTETPCRSREERYRLPQQVAGLADMHGPGLWSRVQRDMATLNKDDFDDATWQLLEEYFYFKSRAVVEEDYISAKYFKQQIDDLRSNGLTLQQMEREKVLAVEKEDYDRAADIKAQIDLLRLKIKQPRIPQMPSIRAGFSTSTQPSAQQQGGHRQPRGGSPTENNRRTSSSPNNQSHMPDSNKGPSTLDAAVVAATPLGESVTGGVSSRSPSPVKPKNLEELLADPNLDPFNQKRALPSNMRASMDHPHHAIPVAPGMEVYAATQEQQLHQLPVELEGGAEWAKALYTFMTAQLNDDSVDALTVPAIVPGMDSKQVELFDAAFSPLVRAAMFSKKWQWREAAILALQHGVQADGTGAFGNTTQTEIVELGCKYLAFKTYGFNDTIPSVLQANITLFSSLLNMWESIPSDLTALLHAQSKLLNILVSRALDNNTRIQTVAKRFLLDIVQNPKIGPRAIIVALIEDGAKKANATNAKRTVCRLKVVASITKKCVQDMNLNVEQIATKCIKPCLEHQNNEVRNIATKLMAVCVLNRHNELKSVLNSLQPNVKEAVEAAIQQLDSEEGYSSVDNEEPSSPQSLPKQKKVQHNKQQSPPQQQRPANGGGKNNDNGVAPATGYGTPADLEEPGPVEEVMSCPYCTGDLSTMTQEEKEEHWTLYCPCLMECMCGQIIDIPLLIEHQFTDCSKASEYKQCNQCKEVIPLGEKEHSGCIPASTTGQTRCPLCHADFDDLAVHLLEPPGCSCNPRALPAMAYSALSEVTEVRNDEAVVTPGSPGGSICRVGSAQSVPAVD